MPNPLPHNAYIRASISSYLSDVCDIVGDCTQTLDSSGQFRNIYKSCLAADSVLRGLSTSHQTPRLNVARGLVQRVPILIAVGQISASHGELRRFIEVVLWCIYFTDHPIEWQQFSADPSRGFVRDIGTPISYCAFRERAYYSNYAEELFGREPSGVALAAARALSVSFSELNANVHAAHVATTTRLKPAWDSVGDKDLTSFSKRHNAICANACIVLAAYFRQRFERLQPVYRAWFDWLVGSATAKKIRAGHFGL